ncbi:hypothetical protein I302_102674 [Kwoniella bestiolae CBS 10118]|uniref:FAD-binding FR-type domain-containing protein n=1 Tax=Kwoniella bestiolae CBS 10118 TaxID=1296100 RepID=A0A1B9GFZ4_9TREE|nr:hypothetical protein I302_01368 [Kwoniella bestiolae CBS 10118]OCF29855.1 hypothetical protein I302_01368 [Kwoniella bestiolae CBS 10118]
MSLSRRTSLSLHSHPTLTDDSVLPLTSDEIQSFLDELDHNGDGLIQYSEVERALDAVNEELTPSPRPHNINHPSKDDVARHAFLRDLLGTTSTSSEPIAIRREDFAERLKSWNIPSMKQSTSNEASDREYMSSIGPWRRFRSWWSVKGPEVLFLGLVVGSILGMMLWQSLKYSLNPKYRAAFGWGVVLAKTCAGGLYFTMFYLVLSMSRYFSTFLRRWYLVSRIVNWDLSQSFHIKISCLALGLATLHAIGHLGGTFVYGSRSSRQDAVAEVLSPDLVPRPYNAYIRSLPGITGLVALGLFYVLAGLSTPRIRKWNYEVFQLGHLLMYPIIALLMAHGTAHLLQFPMLGYFLAFPTLLVLVERITRLFIGFRGIKATIKILDSATIQLTIPTPKPEVLWRYKPGQYIFLQVPSISRFQWHPFTISTCINSKIQLHIKTDGNWTSTLRDLAPSGEKGGTEGELVVGLNGPFGAPAERFYEYSHAILVGSGIGVTPFSGILADLQERDDRSHGGPGQATAPSEGINEKTSNSNPLSRTLSRTLSRKKSRTRSQRNSTRSPYPPDYKRIDFHWMVRDKNHLSWFSNLLNSISKSQEYHRSLLSSSPSYPHLDIRLQTHVTAKRKSLTTHIYRWLLELHRTDDHPESPLTGLLNGSNFGRPDFIKILDKHYEDMAEYQRSSGRHREGGEGGAEKLKVGVFFCGAPMIGEILADRCKALTKRGEEEGVEVRYHFMIEVFG